MTRCAFSSNLTTKLLDKVDGGGVKKVTAYNSTGSDECSVVVLLEGSKEGGERKYLVGSSMV